MPDPLPPAAPSADETDQATRLFRQPCTFVKGVVSLDELPAGNRAEIAFAGRSNVGKSSLINALVGQKGLARTSNTPGRTQELNFFALTDALYLVDLPGYGYARVSKQRVEGWTRLMLNYLRGRASLARVFLLIDARHGLKANDQEIMALLDTAAVSYMAVLTKTDKLKPGQLADVIDQTGTALARHPAAHPVLLATSAAKRTGLDDLRREIFIASGYGQF